MRGAAVRGAHLVVLVGGHGHELGLGEHVGPEGAVGKLQDVVGAHDVEPWLVLVHGVQDGLDQRTQKRHRVNITSRHAAVTAAVIMTCL